MRRPLAADPMTRSLLLFLAALLLAGCSPVRYITRLDATARLIIVCPASTEGFAGCPPLSAAEQHLHDHYRGKGLTHAQFEDIIRASRQIDVTAAGDGP